MTVPDYDDAPLVEDISLDGPMVTMLSYPLARRDLECGECGAIMEIRTSDNGPFYGCSRFPVCKGTHGAHHDGRPLGKPADKETRLARIQAHRVFDLIWKEKHRTRSQAYAWMRKKLKLSQSEAHIGLFGLTECEHLIQCVKEDFPMLRNAWDRLLEDSSFEL